MKFALLSTMGAAVISILITATLWLDFKTQHTMRKDKKSRLKAKAALPIAYISVC